MTNLKALQILQDVSRWKKEGGEMPHNPQLYGFAIDVAIRVLKQLNKPVKRSNTRSIEILAKYNQWRRYEGHEIVHYSVVETRDAMSFAIAVLRQITKYKSEHSGKVNEMVV